MYASGEAPDLTKPYESEKWSEACWAGGNIHTGLFQGACEWIPSPIPADFEKELRWTLWSKSRKRAEFIREISWKVDVQIEIQRRKHDEYAYGKREERRLKRERTLMETEDMELIGLAAMQL